MGENGEYAFVINPQGGGAYYDFSHSEPGEGVEPSQTYGCVSTQARKNTEASARKRAEEAERPLAETQRRKREAELAEQMKKDMAEERCRTATESDLLDQYKARVRQRIESNWQRPTDTRPDLKWVVLLDILPGNEVAYIRFEQFNGTENRPALHRNGDSEVLTPAGAPCARAF